MKHKVVQGVNKSHLNLHLVAFVRSFTKQSRTAQGKRKERPKNLIFASYANVNVRRDLNVVFLAYRASL